MKKLILGLLTLCSLTITHIAKADPAGGAGGYIDAGYAFGAAGYEAFQAGDYVQAEQMYAMATAEFTAGMNEAIADGDDAAYDEAAAGSTGSQGGFDEAAKAYRQNMVQN